MTEAGAMRATRPEVRVRPARPDDLDGCWTVFRTAINDYIGRLGQEPIPPEGHPVARLWAHARSTDPDRFVVATVPDDTDGAGERVVAFASAVLREHVWFLSMLFVLPEFQGAGVGRDLFTRVARGGTIRATCTDSAQPISNALYALADIVPRMPLLNLTGLPQRPESFGELPSGVVPIPFEDAVAGPPDDGADGLGHRMLVDAVDALDRDLLGFTHPDDHRYLQAEPRSGWLYRGPDGSPVGYGYATAAGRVGPIAVRDAALLGPMLGHLTSAVVPRGAFALWIGGAADRALVPALQAGFRLEPFPILVCWDQPFADFSRYLPISPGLL
jgi:GNAT superfamily N-acetyltransferase